MNEERNVVVVGGGAAGLAAALAAAAGGASVVLVERADVIGGTTCYSGGVVWIPVNEYQLPEDEPDSEEKALTYLEAESIGDSDPELIKEFVKQGQRVMSAISDHTQLNWMVMNWPDYHAEFPGGLVRGRTIEPTIVHADPEIDAIVRRSPFRPEPITYWEIANQMPSDEEIDRRKRESVIARGRGLVAGLYIGARDLGVRVLTNTRALALRTEDGAVVGVETSQGYFPGDVILGSGGFERNAELVQHFLTGAMQAAGGPSGLDGDGLLMSMQVGAALGNMNEAWWCPGLIGPGELNSDGDPHYSMMFNERAQPGTLVVDQNGHRFATESINYNDFGRSLMAFDPRTYSFPRSPSWLVMDATRRSKATIGPLKPADPDPAWLAKADTIEELAAKISLPPEELAATVARYNTYMAKGVDEEFHRGETPHEKYVSNTGETLAQLRPLTDPPYYAAQIVGGCLGTKGGPRTDVHGRVLRADREGVIDGLYAAGNAAACPFGYGYPGGGGTIGPALVFGWLAGEFAASRSR